MLSRDIQSLPVMQIKDNSKDGRKDINNGQQESCFDLVTPSNSIPNKTREPKEDDIYIKDTIAAFPLPNSMNMHQFETRNTSCFTFENVNRTSPIHDLQKEYQPTKNSLHFDHQKTKKSSSWFKDLFTKKSEKPSIMAGLFSKNKQTSDTPNTSFIKKLSHSASSKSLNSLRKKQSTESALKRMPLPASLKKKQSTAPPPRPPRPPIVHTRYPVNTERAIYRLSHVKLSNARRPLRQQVVISNMMFWYLSITEKEQDDHFLEYQPQHQQQRGYYNNDIYQSFQPPASGNGAYPNYYAHQYHYYDSSCYPKLSSSPQRQPSVNEYASTTTVTEKSKLKKKKYKPVRNPQYSPSIASS